MTDHTPLMEPRPRDFSARMSRSGRARPMGRRRTHAHASRRLAILAAAVAVPAMAAPGPWSSPDATKPALSPMAFETPGESFPGSAFYYLDEQPYLPMAADGPPAEEARLALPRASAGGFAAAHALRFAGSATDRARAQRCLTMAVYYEAATESDAGQRAVAQVVLNRVAHPSYPDTVCGVVFQGSERETGCQFTFTCDGSLARQPARMWWDRASKVASAALAGAVYAPIGLATHYHTVQVHPYWADSLDAVGTIGAHRFYRWRGAAGRLAAFSDRYTGGEPVAAPHPRQPGATPETADPIALARSYEAESAPAATPDPAPAPRYAAAIEARGGDALFRADAAPAAGPKSGEVRAEYARSGQWLRQP